MKPDVLLLSPGLEKPYATRWTPQTVPKAAHCLNSSEGSGWARTQTTLQIEAVLIYAWTEYLLSDMDSDLETKRWRKAVNVKQGCLDIDSFTRVRADWLECLDGEAEMFLSRRQRGKA